MTIDWKAVEQYFTMVLFGFQFQLVILENLSILDLALSGVKEFISILSTQLSIAYTHYSSSIGRVSALKTYPILTRTFLLF